MTTTTVHVRTEVLRTFRNRRMLIFTLGLPLVLLFTVGATNRHATTAGVSFPLYFTAAMAFPSLRCWRLRSLNADRSSSPPLAAPATCAAPWKPARSAS